jgi:hypothetical protein
MNSCMRIAAAAAAAVCLFLCLLVKRNSPQRQPKELAPLLAVGIKNSIIFPFYFLSVNYLSPNGLCIYICHVLIVIC